MILEGRDPDLIPVRDKYSGEGSNAILGGDNPQRPDCEDRVQPLALTEDAIQLVHLDKSSFAPLAAVFG